MAGPVVALPSESRQTAPASRPARIDPRLWMGEKVEISAPAARPAATCSSVNADDPRILAVHDLAARQLHLLGRRSGPGAG